MIAARKAKWTGVLALAGVVIAITDARGDILYEIDFTTTLPSLDFSIEYDATTSNWLVDPTANPYRWIPDSPTSFSTSSDDFEWWYGPRSQCSGPSEYTCSGSSWAVADLAWTQTGPSTWVLNAPDSSAFLTPNVTGGGSCVPNPPITEFSCSGSMIKVAGVPVPTPAAGWLMLGGLAMMSLRCRRERCALPNAV